MCNAYTRSCRPVGSHLLALLMAMNSVIGAYYYFRLIVMMCMREYKGTVPADAAKSLSPTAAMVVAVTVVITLYLGLLPNLVLAIARSPHLLASSR
jgi:NADH:ubiquinone oxidoreductase subunit 2 (subunit N)